VRNLAMIFGVVVLCVVLLPLEALAQERGRSDGPPQRGRTGLLVTDFQLDESARSTSRRDREDRGRLVIVADSGSGEVSETCLRGRCSDFVGKVPSLSANFSNLRMDLQIVGLPDVTDIGTEYAADGRVEGVIEWGNSERYRFQGSATARVTFPNPSRSEHQQIMLDELVITGIVIDFPSTGIVIRATNQIIIDHVGAG
jgi:hypothetical protein